MTTAALKLDGISGTAGHAQGAGSTSDILSELFQMVKNPDASVNALASMLNANQVLRGAVLKRANAIGYSSAEEIEDPKDAVLILGLRLLQGTVANTLTVNAVRKMVSALARRKLKSSTIEIIDRLPKNDKLILALHYFEDLSFREIGYVLSLKEEDTAASCGRSLAVLQKMLKTKN